MGNEIMNIGKLEIKPLTNFKRNGPPLGFEYWSPELKGETRKSYFLGMMLRRVPSVEDPKKLVELDCACFIEARDNGTFRNWCNASVYLVGTLLDHNVQQGEPIEVEYDGKEGNKGNAFKHDRWLIYRMLEVTP